MLLFPIGELQTDSSQGVIGSERFTFFEPNASVSSHKIFNVDALKRRDQTLRTSKKAEPFITFSYTYDNIFNREFTPIDMFMSLVGGPLLSFFAPDLTKGERIKDPVAFPYQFKTTLRRLYTAVVAHGANYALIWGGPGTGDLAVAQVTSVETGYVLLSRLFGVANISNAIIYPLYEVFLTEDSPGTWEPGDYLEESTTEHGFLWSGKMSFSTRYPVE